MSDCLFCTRPLSHATPEHILLDCLGGRLKSRRLICAACNRLMGGSIDAALARAVEPFRAAHALPSGSRKRVPTATADSRYPDLESPDCRRSLAKMLTMLRAEAFGDDGMEAIKAYVLRGEGDPGLQPGAPMDLPPGFGPLSHRLEVTGGLGEIALFGGPSRRFRLGDDLSGRVWLVCDPAQPSQWLAGKGL